MPKNIYVLQKQQTIKEEIANSITHGLGLLFCFAAIPALIFAAAEKSTGNYPYAVAVFCFGLLMVYLSSTLFHAVQRAGIKRMFQIWDHISIFLLIAGSYTPLVIKYTDSITAMIFLGIMWNMVAIGIFFKIFYTGKYQMLSVSIYLLMGWMAIFILKPLIANMPAEIFRWVLISGLAYTSGVVFYLWKRLQYSHAIWHIFVLTGTVTHFFAVYNSVPINVKL
jgi:hemolysin III